jgi:hypothetical protein
MEPPSESESDSFPVFDYTSKLHVLGQADTAGHYIQHVFLATKCKDSCVSDNLKLDHVLRYINGTQDIGLTLQPDSMLIHSYIDASYASHSDAKGHSGAITEA